MPRFPRFNIGIGRLTAKVLNDAFALIERIPKIESDLKWVTSRGGAGRPVSRPPFEAFIVGYRNIGLNRWQYAWVRAVADASNLGQFIRWADTNASGSTIYETSYNAFDPSDVTLGAPFTYPAYNTIEAGNNGLANESAGVYVEGDAWPTNWFLQPIRGGDSGGQAGQTPSDWDPQTQAFWTVDKAPVVQIRFVMDSGSTSTPIFTVANDADGECPP